MPFRVIKIMRKHDKLCNTQFIKTVMSRTDIYFTEYSKPT